MPLKRGALTIDTLSCARTEAGAEGERPDAAASDELGSAAAALGQLCSRRKQGGANVTRQLRPPRTMHQRAGAAVVDNPAMRMWRLDEFRFDEGIHALDVDVFDPARGESEPMARDAAIALARARDACLIAWWPAGGDEDQPSCIIGRVTLPLRWEMLPEESAPTADPRLWFDAPCGGRDLLLPGQGHTFTGRMSAWCPHQQLSYNVSLSEMGAMSDEARYFVLGFLSGNEPGPPYNDEGDVTHADLAAWRSATARFRRTGQWYGRWGTCQTCGCVLLPDTAEDHCHEHRDRGTLDAK